MRQLPYDRFFYDSEAKKILDGFKPRDMDDKWFIYAEEGWVYFIRSWSGKYIFGLKLDGSPAGVHITTAGSTQTKRNTTHKVRRQILRLSITLLNHICSKHYNRINSE